MKYFAETRVHFSTKSLGACQIGQSTRNYFI